MVAEGELEKQIAALLQRPYRKVLSGSPAEGFLAEVPELPGCFTAGETEVEALEMLHDAMAGWFESALARKLPIPEPAPPERPRHTGRVLVRMPPLLHQRLAQEARDQGISLNQWLVTILAHGMRT
jgi:antitoxin HicB